MDKLNPTSLGNEYKNFNWERYDFPGANKPKSSKFAEQDPGQMKKKQEKCCTRLGHSYCPNVEQHQQIMQYSVLVRSLVFVPGRNNEPENMGSYSRPQDFDISDKKGHKLNKYAQDSFIKMQAAAKNDGVELDINNSDRPCAAHKPVSRDLKKDPKQ